MTKLTISSNKKVDCPMFYKKIDSIKCTECKYCDDIDDTNNTIDCFYPEVYIND